MNVKQDAETGDYVLIALASQTQLRASFPKLDAILGNGEQRYTLREKEKKSLQRILSFDVLRIFSHKRKHLPPPRNYFKPEEVETTLIVRSTFLVEMRLKNKGKAHLETSITIYCCTSEPQ